MDSKLTIVIGAYKRPDLIFDTISAIINQTYNDFQLIVIDDNHLSDFINIKKTRDIVLSFEDKRISYIKNETNIGVPHVFRKWINQVKTTYFMIFGEGDLLKPNALELMVGFLEKNPGSSMVHGLEVYHFKDKTSTNKSSLFAETGSKEARNYLISHLFGGKYSWSQASAMYRTELFKIWEIPVKHEYHFWDYYFHCKYLLYSKEIGYLNEYLADRRVDSSFEADYVNRFLSSVERIYQAFEFIDENKIYLLKLNYNVLTIKFKLSLRLAKKSFRFRTFNKFIEIFSFALFNLTSTSLKISISLIPYLLFKKLLGKY